MKKRWLITTKGANFEEIAKQFNIDPIVARLIRNRNVIGSNEINMFLNGTLEDIPSPWLLKGMTEATSILKEKIEKKSPIRIIGDYDGDGIVSSYILLTGLKNLGANVDTYIPNRISDGYGLHKHLIEKAIEDKIDTILTCDNGIAASEEISLAKENNITVIVTDHHEIPYTEENNVRNYILPVANAIINPKQPECEYPEKNICGAAVASKLIFALYDSMNVKMNEELYSLIIQFVAIATVTDVMDLQHENRIVVKEGLKRIQTTKNVGLSALIKANGLTDSVISSYHIGFVLGPCINASGRLDTAMKALNLFLEENPIKAFSIAEELKQLNENRKSLTEQGKEEAVNIVELQNMINDKVFVIYIPHCHESLAGIIAGRIREKYNRPTFVLTKSKNGVKGSGRSIEGYSMHEELSKCADLFDGFGGHPMAAGLSMQEENIEEFRKRINENCSLTEEQLLPKILIDVPLNVSLVTKKLIEDISVLAPYGKGNTKPLFAQKNILVQNCQVIGKNKNVAKFRIMDPDGSYKTGIFFGEAEEFASYVSEKNDVITITYFPELNIYNGFETLQIVVQDYC